MKQKTTFTSLFILTLFIALSCNTNKETSNSSSKVDDPLSIEKEKEMYLKKGKELALETKAALGKLLVTAITEKGTEGAVEFCSTKAIPITDSMATASAHIKRVSDRPRNSLNQANEEELAFIEVLKNARSNNENLSPSIKDTGDKYVAYYPIMTNMMCLKCHGSPEKDIEQATFDKINKLYIKDKATHYKSDEVRGLFVVEMTKD